VRFTHTAHHSGQAEVYLRVKASNRRNMRSGEPSTGWARLQKHHWC